MGGRPYEPSTDAYKTAPNSTDQQDPTKTYVASNRMHRLADLPSSPLYLHQVARGHELEDLIRHFRLFPWGFAVELYEEKRELHLPPRD